MPNSYIDTGSSGLATEYKLSKLLSSYLEPVDPSLAIAQSLRLAHLILLSNHLSLAHEFICALYQDANKIIPQDASSSTPLQPSLALENFWLSHPEFPRPPNAPIATNHLSREQWGKYRECNRTGWLPEHCKLPEPKDPHIWRDTDDPAMLAMCCRLLSKGKKHGNYPSQERMEEALEVAKKLYAQPQVRVAEWKFEKGKRRHGELLYWRLAVELAIRVGEMQTAAEIMGKGLRLDGFNVGNGGDLKEYLTLPGIWNILPLMAKSGKEQNLYFISEDIARLMVDGIIATLHLRVKKGRQWSLAPEKVGWEELLKRLAEGAFKVNGKAYKRLGIKHANDILNAPATEEQIKAAETNIGELPADFKEMIRIANG